MLALEDGTVFVGAGFGATGTQCGEVVFNTSMTGYQEILTDPSYCGQVVCLTSPQVGNYGVNVEDVESGKCHVGGFVIKELARRYSNFRATLSLEEYLARQGVVGLQGVDTRALTKRLRVHGTMRGAITTERISAAEGVRLARESAGMLGADLVRRVAPSEAVTWNDCPEPGFACRSGRRSNADCGSQRPARRVVAVDCGMKRNILRHLVDMGCDVRIVPPTWSAEAVLAERPDGVLVSNGPGDPAAVDYTIKMLQHMTGRVPIFGICLGHQLLALALGAERFKLKFGHRGANQPVLNLGTDRAEVTTQNHGFAIDRASLEAAGGRPTHINLNDKTLEGFVHRELPILAVQYHPEASPGPHDASYLFDCFARMMSSGRPPTAEDMADAQAACRRSPTTVTQRHGVEPKREV